MLMTDNVPQILYHATAANFDHFRPLSHFGTRAAAEKASSIHIKPDGFTPLTIVQRAKEAMTRIRIKGTPQIIPVHLRIKNPIKFPDIGSHSVRSYKHMFFKLLLAEQLGGRSIFYHCRRAAALYKLDYFKVFDTLCQKANFMPLLHFIFDHPFECSYQEVKRELALGNLYPLATTEEGSLTPNQVNRTHLVAQRMIRFLEERGFDGIQYANEHEDKGSFSYIIFHPEQVIRLDRSVTITPQKVNTENEARLKQIQQKALSKIKAKPFSKDEIRLYRFFELETLKDFQTNPIMKRAEWVKKALQEVLPQITGLFNQNEMAQIEQSVLFGIEYALKSGIEPLPVIWACALRLYPNDIADAFLQTNGVNAELRQQIVSVLNGTKNNISHCVQDAIHTVTVWQQNITTHKFNTPHAKQLATCSFNERQKYLRKQTALLNRHPEWPSTIRTNTRVAMRRDIPVQNKRDKRIRS